MSAFMVDAGHIDYLISAASAATSTGRGRWAKLVYPLATDAERTAAGRALLAANLDSMRARYGDSLDDTETGAPAAYTYRRTRHAITPAQTFQAIACLRYQSCEADTWEKSDAAKFCDQLTELAILQVTEAADVEWEISR